MKSSGKGPRGRGAKPLVIPSKPNAAGAKVAAAKAGATAGAAVAATTAAVPADGSELTKALAVERQAALNAYHKGDTKPLKTYCERVLVSNPNDVFSLTNLGLLELRAGNYKEAEALYVRGLAIAPEDKVLNANMSKMMLDQRKWAEAAKHAEVATKSDPSFEIGWLNHSYACHMQGRLKDSENSARTALKLNPKNDQALNNLANALKDQGFVRDAILVYKQALEIAPQNPMLYTNLQLTAMYDASTPVEEIVAVARKFSEVFEDPVADKRKPHRNVPLPDRRLKIGFISPDFTNHAVMYFAEPVLARLSRQDFEIFCYYTYAAGDYITERVKGWSDHFRLVPVTDPAKTARIIQDDEIDILVDLAGHTAKNGLQAMAYKPAPVQVTWLGYPGTTGLKSIDWRITDHVADPNGVEAQYSEGLVRLPGTFCVYRPHIRAVLHRFDPRYQVQPAPCLKNGYITFGSCNNIAKITPPTLAAWSRILHQVPGSKLIIEGKDLGRAEATHGLRDQFAAHGIGEDRLEFLARDTRNQYLTYHRIDIALDPFPLTGGTTTFDTLWMGVPVVTLLGRTYRERLSGTIVAGGGFKENIVTSVDAYIRRVVELASDHEKLGIERIQARKKMQSSVLMDEPRFVKLFSQALRGMWQRWCKIQEPNGVAPGVIEAGQDVLISYNGRRYTLPAAVAMLAQQMSAKQVALQATSSLAKAILEVIPNHPEAGNAMRRLLAAQQRQQAAAATPAPNATAAKA